MLQLSNFDCILSCILILYFLFFYFKWYQSAECSNGLILPAHFSGPSSPFPKRKLDFLENCSWEVSEKALPLHSACNYIFDKKETFPSSHQREAWKQKRTCQRFQLKRKVWEKDLLCLCFLSHTTQEVQPLMETHFDLFLSKSDKRHPVCYSCVDLWYRIYYLLCVSSDYLVKEGEEELS